MVRIDKKNALYEEKIQSSERCITIFTPTYNRCGLLLNVYECLRNQNNKNFVWLVICDGSTDETDEIMEKLVDETDIPTRYISKENGGKHTALKLGMELTETDYFCDCDDDDTYTTDMVDFFLSVWSEIESEGRNDIGVIRTLTRYKDGRIVCDYNFDMSDIGKQFDATTLEMEFKWNLHQENHTCYRIASLRSVDLWPSNYWLSDRHTFLSEHIWQGRFARKYKCRYFYRVTRIYNDTTEGYTRGKMNFQRAMNTFINNHLLLNEQYDCFSFNLLKKIKHILVMGVYRLLVGVSIFEQVKHIEHQSLKCWVLITEPLCYVLQMIKGKRPFVRNLC